MRLVSGIRGAWSASFKVQGEKTDSAQNLERQKKLFQYNNTMSQSLRSSGMAVTSPAQFLLRILCWCFWTMHQLINHVCAVCVVKSVLVPFIYSLIKNRLSNGLLYNELCTKMNYLRCAKQNPGSGHVRARAHTLADHLVALSDCTSSGTSP